MSLNAATIQVLIDKGLTAADILEVAQASERKVDSTAAERQARYRERRKETKRNARNSNGVTPPIDNNHTPSDISPNGENHNKARGAFPKPGWVEDDEVWQDFLSNRKRKRCPNTATAYKGFLDDIERLTKPEWPPWRLLQHAARKGWAGIYDPTDDRKNENDRQRSQNSRPTTREIGERVASRFAGGGGGAADSLPRLGAPGGNG